MEIKDELDGYKRLVEMQNETIEKLISLIPSKEPKAQEPMQDLKAEDIVAPFKEEFTDEEILYYATPYFEELQAKKEMKSQAIQQEVRDGN